jgi:uncharacterized protein (TIGR04255 family)
MTYPHHLSRAPITEAVLDVKVHREPPVDCDACSAFTDRVANEFPISRPIRYLQAAFEVNEREASVRTAEPTNVGHVCWNDARTRAVQARVDGFSVHHLKPYEDWDTLLGHAQKWWPVYVDAASPARVLRCALRFINQLELAVGEDLSRTLRTRPEISANLPQTVDEYFQRLVIPFPDGVRAGISQIVPALAPGDPKRLLILDIDVSIDIDMPAMSDEFWPNFERLRRIKNQCFFESLHADRWEELQ